MALVALNPKRRRTYNGEDAWFGLLEELGHRGLRAALVAAGVTPQVAAGLVFFIEDQKLLDRAPLGAATKSRYRQVLAGLDPAKVRRLATRPIGG